jgi:predicted deacylase
MLHRAHDYKHLVDRWRRVARAAGLRLRPLAQDDGFDLFYVETPHLAGNSGLYLSAGIHGDEPAAPEALVRWAEKNAARLATMPLLIFPCLNPWGLRNNMRTDSQGRDLNRMFHEDSHPVVAAVRRVTRPHRFHIALPMHEDYDAQGIYLYEVQRGRHGFGEELLRRAAKILPVDPRVKIDTSIAKDGLIRRRISRKKFETMGYPEAIWLHLFHSQNTFTFETPSEAALELRVRAHMAVLDECARRICGSE